MSALLKVLNPAGARLDWTALVLALFGVALVLAGYDLSVVDVLVGLLASALGRGALITVEQRAQRAAVLEVANSIATARDKLGAGS